MCWSSLTRAEPYRWQTIRNTSARAVASARRYKPREVEYLAEKHKISRQAAANSIRAAGPMRTTVEAYSKDKTRDGAYERAGVLPPPLRSSDLEVLG
jgi:hypothetical protein